MNKANHRIFRAEETPEFIPSGPALCPLIPKQEPFGMCLNASQDGALTPSQGGRSTPGPPDGQEAPFLWLRLPPSAFHLPALGLALVSTQKKLVCSVDTSTLTYVRPGITGPSPTPATPPTLDLLSPLGRSQPRCLYVCLKRLIPKQNPWSCL